MHTKIILIASAAALALGGCDQPDTDLGERATESETGGGSDSASGGTGGSTGESTSTGELPQETGEASGEPPQETGDSGGPAPVDCVPLTTEASYANECRAELCPDTAVIDFPTDGQGFECSAFGCETGPEGEIMFLLVQGQASLSLTFAPGLADGYSTEAFNANFLELNGLVEIPSADGGALQVIPVQTPSFTYEDGVLDFTLDVGIENAWYTIESDAKDCISDDILGECPCFYAGDAQLEVVVAAPVEDL